MRESATSPVVSPSGKTANAGPWGPSAPAPITLPKGGGAIRGIDEKLATNAVTGTATLTVPIAATPEREGFGPALSVSYDSAGGNGPFGFGWSLNLPAITRKTSLGLPLDRDADESDVFVLAGSEDLVPEFATDEAGAWMETNGAYVVAETQHDVSGHTYRVRRYRPRIEQPFARIERWTRQDGDTHWRVLSRDNVLTIFGADGDARLRDPDHPERVFSWLISETRDDRGHAVVYGYRREDATGVPARPHERNRVGRGANLYLKRIRYGNRAPLLDGAGRRPLHLSQAQIDGAAWMFELVFDYGDHDPADPHPRDDETLLPDGRPKYPWGTAPTRSRATVPASNCAPAGSAGGRSCSTIFRTSRGWAPIASCARPTFPMRRTSRRSTRAIRSTA